MKAEATVKIVTVLFGISIISNILLGVYIDRMDKECHRWHVDKVDKNVDWYPDADAVTEIAEACIGMDQSQAEAVYDVQTVYSESNHEWIITFEPKEEGAEDRRVIGIRRDNTIITEYDE